jgi:signal transduction histidine kinase/integral membrane sensor domain MASE1/ActR/RegA family two-component response regulator
MLRAVAVFSVYVLSGKLGLAFAFLHASATPVWPPAGIALAALLLLGRRVWPAIFIGAFVVNVTTAGSVLTSLGIAAGNTLEALLGAYLVRRFAGGAAAFERAQDIFKLAVLAAMVSTSVSATIGVASLVLTGHAASTNAGWIWLTWWLGDLSGILLLTPLIVLWGRRSSDEPFRERRSELVTLLAVVVAAAVLVFGGVLPEGWRQLPTAFVSIPPLLWAAYRFGPRVTSLALVALFAVAVAGTLSGAGPFSPYAPSVSLPLVQAFLAMMALTALPLAAVVAERRRAEEAARGRREQLRVLADIAQSISGSLDIDTVLRRIAEGARTLCRSDRAAIFLRDERSGMMAPRFRVGPSQPAYDDLHIRAGEGLGGLVMQTGRPLRTSNYQADPRLPESMHAIARERGTVALMVVPISIATEVAGLLYVSNRSARSFGDNDEAVTVRLAEQAAIAIHNARLFAREGAARAEAEAANQSKDEFLAMLSHELRNPLGAIGSAIQVLERVGDSAVAARARAVIARQTQHLSHLVEDLLDVSRAVTGKIALRREVVDLGATAERVVGGLAARHAARVRDVSLRARPVRVLGDAVRLEQVVNNLVENALKYSTPGERISMSVDEEDGRAVLAVADSGVGIAPELLPHVFDLFVQADRSLERTAGGLGIGLTLVRQIVELHGGTVEASSEGVGRGSRFTVRLPVTDVAVPPATARPAPRGRRQRILVVEDHEDAREMLGELVRALGHEVHEAADGTSAVDRALRLLPDVTLVDIGLPGVDGYEVARRIRNDPRGKPLRLVAVTGYGRREDRERALASGYDEHIVKPVDPARLAILVGEPSCVEAPPVKSSPDRARP